MPGIYLKKQLATKSFRGYAGCSVAGCSGQHYSLSYCRMHYERSRKNGDPLVTQIDYYSGPCTEPDCSRRATCKRLCNRHYRKMMYRKDARVRQRLYCSGVVKEHLQRGLISRQPCERCGSPKTEAHHVSYAPEDALKVMWLCKPHHDEWHDQFQPTYPPQP